MVTFSTYDVSRLGWNDSRPAQLVAAQSFLPVPLLLIAQELVIKMLAVVVLMEAHNKVPNQARPMLATGTAMAMAMAKLKTDSA